MLSLRSTSPGSCGGREFNIRGDDKYELVRTYRKVKSEDVSEANARSPQTVGRCEARGGVELRSAGQDG